MLSTAIFSLFIVALTTSTSAFAPISVYFDGHGQGFPFERVLRNIDDVIRANARTSDSLPADSVPAPWYDNHNVCATGSSGFNKGETASVCDPSGLLTSRQMDDLNREIYPVFRGQSPYSLVECPPNSNEAAHGFRIAAMVIRRLPSDGNTLATRARLYAEAIFTNWNLGDNCGASVLIFMSWEDRRLYIKTGSLAANYISNTKINSIFQSMTKHLEKDDIYSALDTAVTQLSYLLHSYHPNHPHHAPPPTSAPGVPLTPTNDHPFGPLFFKRGPTWWDLELSLVVVGCAICLVMACCHGFGGPDAARLRREKKALLLKLDTVRTEYIRASMPQYEPASCPICQEQFSNDEETGDAQESEGDPLTGQKVHDSSPEMEKPPSVRKYPCGHVFHDNCLNTLPSRPTGCPVCDAGKPGAEVPSLSDSRGKDFSYRLERLHAEHPHLLTVPLLAHLHDSNPTTWPDSLDESFLSRGPGGSASHGYSEIGAGRGGYWQGNGNRGWDRGGGGGSGVGGMVAAGAAGMGAGWLLNNAFSGDHHGQPQQFQQQEQQSGGWNGGSGTGTSWGNAQVDSGNQSWFGQQSVDDGGGQGTGWGNAANSMSQAFNAMGGGWDGGSSQNDGGGDGTGW